MVKDEEDIQESLSILLSTTIGERVMQPRYGCNLKQFLFEPLNASIEAYIKKLVEEAILYFEPRIDPLGVSLDAEDGKLEITVDYKIRATNSRSNFVYPFYIQEGTNL
jgi:phage baseplate assembly protein W